MRLIHFLNLDIVAGVAAGGVLLQRICNIRLPWAWWFVLPATAWLVYTLDRVLDDARVPGEYPTLRHQFHHAHKRALGIACAITGTAVAVVAALFLPPWIWLVALAGGVLVAMHHVAQHRMGSMLSGVAKDLNVVITYMGALWSVPLILADTWSWYIAISLATHFCLVLAIVVVLSVSDESIDTDLNQPSIVRSLGRKTSMVLFVILLAAGVAGGALMWQRDAPVAATMLAIAMCVAALPFLFRTTTPRPIARLLTELILSLPFLLLLP